MTVTASQKVSIPGTVWALGIVSMFMDISSEMIHSLLPVFLVAGLGASPAMLGLIEGVAEATASVGKVFSGALSDWLGKRKLLTLLGYGLAAITKPVFPFATSPVEVLLARFADRVGKGIRGAPRDALIADVTPVHARGAAYGLRQSLDTFGAVLGPLIAVLLMHIHADDVRVVFGWAVLPAMVAVAVLLFAVREPVGLAAAESRRTLPKLGELVTFGDAYWRVVLVGVVLTLSRFSEGFLLLRAQGVGLSLDLVPLTLVVMNVVYALSAAPAGRWSDHEDPRVVLSAGVLVLVVADVVLAVSDTIGGALVGAAIWGLHLGLTQGVLSALVSRTVAADVRGTAFGVFNLLSGAGLLLASVLAGVLWSAFGASATFMAGGVLAVLALATLAMLVRD